VAGDLLALLDDAGEAAVSDADAVHLTALALELEAHVTAVHLDVPVAHGGQAYGPVVTGVLVVADAHQAGLQELDHGREHLLAGQAAKGEVLLDALADRRQGLAEGQGVLVLLAVAHLTPARVVAVLLAALRVASGGLEVAVGQGADPDVRPRRRDGQPADAGDGLLVADGPAGGVDITEAAAGLDAPESGRVIHEVDELRGVRQRVGARAFLGAGQRACLGAVAAALGL